VSRRQAVAVVAVGVALAAALLLALLARDVKNSADTMSRADLGFELRQPRDAWIASDSLPMRSARGLLGTGDDIRFRQAARLFRASEAAEAAAGGNPAELRAEATIALERFQRSDADRVRRARVANMLGVLAYRDASGGGAAAAPLLARSADEFRNSIALDPRAAAPKYNLELMLQLANSQAGPVSGRSPGSTGATAGIAGSKKGGRGY
jgi:hypothetical protein